MIEYKIGDLLESDEKYVVHCCNAQGAFGSGFAGAVRKKYPGCYGAYMATYHSQGNKLYTGQVIEYEDKNDGRVIFNAIGQEYYGYDSISTGKVYVSYTALETALERVKELLATMGATRISMPLIGAGLAGGDWNIISKIVEKVFDGFEIVVYTLDGNIPQ